MLTDRDKAILAFEADHTHHAGTKQSDIETRFGLRPAKYYQALGRIINDPAALEIDPVTVKRLLRLRDERVKRRESRRFE